MRRCPLSLRAFFFVSILFPAVAFAAGPPPKHLQKDYPEFRPAPSPPFRDPEDDKPPSAPLGGPAVPLVQPTPVPAAVPRPTPAVAPRPTPAVPRVASGGMDSPRPSLSGGPKPGAGRPTPDNPPAAGQPLIPGVTYAGANENEGTSATGQAPAALGPPPYNLSSIRKVEIAGREIAEAPMRVGNLDILVPMTEELAALGVSVTRVDPKLTPGGTQGPTEEQYLQVNVLEGSPIVMTVGKSTAWIDSNEQPLRCAPLNINRELWLPVFSLAPLMGAAARLDDDGVLHITPTVQSVEIFPVRDSVAVTIKTSMRATAENCKVGYLHGPERLYIDFTGFSMGFDAGNSTFERPVAPGVGDVDRARAGMPGKFPDTTRITLDLKRPLLGISQELPQKRLYALVLVPQTGGGTATPPPVFVGNNTPTGSLRGFTIVVDAGHGGYDTGARGAASLEKDHTLDIALKLANHLRGRDANVLLTRGDDTFVTLQGRATFANTQGADLFVSVHINASVNTGSQGTETYFYTGISQPLAKEIHKEFLKATGRPDRGVRQARFYVIRKTWMPSVLLESAFITNSAEEKLLMTDAYREKIAVGITRGILNYAAKYGRGLSG